MSYRELTFDYQFSHSYQEIVCLCGESGCRGTLSPKPRLVLHPKKSNHGGRTLTKNIRLPNITQQTRDRVAKQPNNHHLRPRGDRILRVQAKLADMKHKRENKRHEIRSRDSAGILKPNYQARSHLKSRSVCQRCEEAEPPKSRRGSTNWICCPGCGWLHIACLRMTKSESHNMPKRWRCDNCTQDPTKNPNIPSYRHSR